MTARSDAARLELAQQISAMSLDWFSDLPPLPPGIPQFPKRTYLYGPNKQAVADVLADVIESRGVLGETEMMHMNWLRLYGGVVDVI